MTAKSKMRLKTRREKVKCAQCGRTNTLLVQWTDYNTQHSEWRCLRHKKK